MGEAERDVELVGGLHEVVGLLEVKAQRFLAEHRNARFHGLHRRIEVHEIRRHDKDVVQFLVRGQRSIGRDHLVVGAVALNGIGPISRLFQGDLWVGKERPRNHAAGAVEMNGALMRMDDEGAFAAAD